jgi:hypothetical protein
VRQEGADDVAGGRPGWGLVAGVLGVLPGGEFLDGLPLGGGLRVLRWGL